MEGRKDAVAADAMVVSQDTRRSYTYTVLLLVTSVYINYHQYRLSFNINHNLFVVVCGTLYVLRSQIPVSSVYFVCCRFLLRC